MFYLRFLNCRHYFEVWTFDILWFMFGRGLFLSKGKFYARMGDRFCSYIQGHSLFLKNFPNNGYHLLKTKLLRKGTPKYSKTGN